MNKDYLNILNSYCDKNLLSKNYHPEFPLVIFTYTRHCKYNRLWDDVTLNTRGVILNYETGEILSNPLYKIFTQFEVQSELNTRKNMEFNAVEKLDGTLIISYIYNNNIYFSSKGKFDSVYSIEAQNIFDEKYKDKLDICLFKNKTFLFELISPLSKNIVNYSDKDLYLLQINNIDSKQTEDINKYSNIFKTPKFYNFKNLQELYNSENNSDEGYIITFSDGFKFKYKFKEYLRLHALMSDVNSVTIWNLLKHNSSFDDILFKIPEDFHSWILNISDSLISDFNKIKKECLEYSELIKNKNLSKKEIALEIKDYKYKHIIFKILYSTNFEDTIWELIKPKYAKPYFNDIHEKRILY